MQLTLDGYKGWHDSMVISIGGVRYDTITIDMPRLTGQTRSAAAAS